MKKTTSQIISALNMLSSAKISNLTTDEKSSFIKLILSMRAVAKKWDEYLGEVRSQCAPENFKEYERIIADPSAHSKEEIDAAKDALGEFYKQVSEVANDEFNAVHDLDGGLNHDTIEHLVASNSEWDVSTIFALHDLLTE